MAFPTTPTDGQQYTTSLGTVYEYVSTDDKWILSSNTIVGETGAQGVTGARGIDGVTGAQGPAGADGVTGAQGTDGVTGLQGETGLFAYTSHDAGTFGTTGANFDSSNGLSQDVTLVNGGETGVFYVSSMNAGEKMTIKFDYDVTEVPRGSTGIKWANGLFPAMSGDTGVEDIITVYYDGTNYYGQASLGYDYE